MEKCAQDLGNSTKAVSSAIAQLLGEVAQGNENYAGTRAGPGWGLWGEGGGMGAVGVGRHRKPPASGLGSEGTFSPPFSLIVSPGIAARDVAGGLRSLAQAARGVAALTSDPAVQAIVLDTASDVLDKASSLIEEAKKAAGHPGDPESQQRLAQVRFWAEAASSLSPDPLRRLSRGGVSSALWLLSGFHPSSPSE